MGVWASVVIGPCMLHALYVVSFDTVDQVRVKIFDPNEERFEVPEEVRFYSNFPQHILCI